MIRSAKAVRPARCLATATFASGLALAGLVSTAQADATFSDSASAVRNAIVAMSLADAAVPFAVAVSTARNDAPASVPASSAVMKPETSTAMAAMKPASARTANANSYTPISYDRRARPYNMPFPLILGIAY